MIKSWMCLTAVMLLGGVLGGCSGAFDRPATIPGARPLFQNAPSNSTFEPPNARPR